MGNLDVIYYGNETIFDYNNINDYNIKFNSLNKLELFKFKNKLRKIFQKDIIKYIFYNFYIIFPDRTLYCNKDNYLKLSKELIQENIKNYNNILIIFENEIKIYTKNISIFKQLKKEICKNKNISNINYDIKIFMPDRVFWFK